VDVAVEAASEASNTTLGLTQIMADGGPIMWVIFGVFVLGVLIFFERQFDLYFRQALASNRFLTTVLDAVNSRRFGAALMACNVKTHHPLVAVVKAGVLRADRRAIEIERAMEKEILGALPKLQKRIAMLALLANTATLLGLLGTIMGLVQAFSDVAVASAAQRQITLANGISVALYTTAFGIVVAMLLLFAHHFTLRRSENILMAVEGGASATLVALSGPVEEPRAQAAG
jgi:biopolymer transport protein ExbB/TolQ